MPVVSIIDDDHSVREGLVDLLRSLGFEAETFERGEHFLQSKDVDRTNCLITDMRMEGISGLELHDLLVKAGRRIPTIVITAFPKDRDRQRALRSGVLCYLAKPIDEQQLLECITSALGGASSGGEKP